MLSDKSNPFHKTKQSLQAIFSVLFYSEYSYYCNSNIFTMPSLNPDFSVNKFLSNKMIEEKE